SSQEVSMPSISMGADCAAKSGTSDRIRPFSDFRNRNADCSRQGKRAIRSGDAPLQAHRGEDGPAHRAARPRVLREADHGAQAQAGRRREAPPQAPAQPDAAGEDVLGVSAERHITPRLAGAFWFMDLKSRITEDMKAAMRSKEGARLSTIRLLLAALK